jgi:hypothetical protein
MMCKRRKLIQALACHSSFRLIDYEADYIVAVSINGSIFYAKYVALSYVENTTRRSVDFSEESALDDSRCNLRCS